MSSNGSSNGQLDRDGVLKEILRRERDGQPLKSRLVHQSDPVLFCAARRFFGSWRKALLFSGVDAKNVPPRRHWNRELVVAEIRRYCLRGLEMASRNISERDPGLIGAAHRFFGSWSRALYAAGIDAQQYCQYPQWDHDQIIEAILLRAVKREPLGSTTVRPASLKTAAVAEFGSWNSALVAAGLDPSKYIGRRCRSQTRDFKNRDDVRRALLQRQSLGLSVAPESMKLQDRRLVNAIRQHFGTFDEALNHAGLECEAFIGQDTQPPRS